MTTDLTVNEHFPIPLNVESGDGTDFQHGEEYILAVSPSASVTQTETGAVITVKDKFGTTSAVLLNGVSDYNGLRNKPRIEGVELVGDLTFPQLNLSRITNSELEEILIM